MGTLWEQEVRNSCNFSDVDVQLNINSIKDLAAKNHLTVSDVIRIFDTLERRRTNDLYKWNGDTWDEQIAGMGQLLQNIESALNSIAEALEK